MKVIFMGSPAFALPTLYALVNSPKHSVVAVYTNPPRASGRGYKVGKTVIYKFAEENGIEVFTPLKLTDANAIEQFNKIDADIVVVAAYGKILRKPILEGKRYGCLNVHPSKLPRWRGAAPIQNTIIAGDKESAVCTMQMDEGLDTGDILLQQNFEVPNTMTSKELHDFTSELGAKLMLQTLDLIESGDVTKTPQKGNATYAEKLSAGIEKINWEKPADEICCLIRGLSPSPGAYFNYKNIKIKIITTEYNLNVNESKPGTVLKNGDSLVIQCGKGALIPQLVQREGKKMIYAKAFLRGFPIKEGTLL